MQKTTEEVIKNSNNLKIVCTNKNLSETAIVNDMIMLTDKADPSTRCEHVLFEVFGAKKFGTTITTLKKEDFIRRYCHVVNLK